MIALFTLRLIAGLSLTWCLLPRRLITSGFFRIQLLVVLGLSVLTALTAGPLVETWDTGRWMTPSLFRALAIATGVVAFVGSVLWTLERRRAGTAACFLIAGLSLLALAGTSAADARAPLGLVFANAVSAAWLAGGATCAMLLGHWYLTAASMSLTPLKRVCRLGLAGVVLRLLVVALSLTVAGNEARQAAAGTYLVWSLLRGLAGIAAPLVLFPAALGTLRYRNTQAATGVLFAAVILVYLGEAAALLLSRELEWPF